MPIPPRRPRFRDRSTTDLLVIMIAATICGTVVVGSGTAIATELFRPEQDTSQVLRAISDIVNTLIGLLAGFLAGRTDATLTAAREAEAAKKTPPPTEAAE